MGKRIELREGQQFFNPHTKKHRRIIALKTEVIQPKDGDLLSQATVKEHVFYSLGGDRNFRCLREQFLKFLNTGAEDVTGKEIKAKGTLL